MSLFFRIAMVASWFCAIAWNPGNRIQTWINGNLVEDMTDSLSHNRGFIGLQVHSVGADQGPIPVRWNEIAIRLIQP